MRKKIFELTRRSVAVVMALFLFCCAIATPAYAADDSVDTSFYKLASVASGFFSTAVSKNEGNYILPTTSSVMHSGNVGGFLGYSDNADESGLVEGWINSLLSASSATFSYDSLLEIGSDADGTGTLGMAYWQYCQKGRILYNLGLDKTGAESSLHPIKWIAGNLMKVLYLATTTVDAVFNTVINFLITINPFRFFKPVNTSYISNSAVNGVSVTGNTTISTEGAVPGGFDGNKYYLNDNTNADLQQLAANIQVVYNIIYQYRLVILGALFAVLAFSLAISKGGNGWQKIRKFLIRVCSITIAIPLLASFYTSCLGWMSGMSQNSQEASARIVLSTFIDFEHWARDSHLALPASITMKQNPQTNRLSPSDFTLKNLRSFAYSVNTATNRDGSGGATASIAAGGLHDENHAIFNWAGTGAAGEARSTVDYVLDILDRYIGAEFYYASSFESDEKANLAYASPFQELVEQTGTTVAKFAESKDTYFGAPGTSWKNAGNTKNADGLWNIWTNGDRLTWSNPNAPSGYISLNSQACMSTMSMYNYLTSSFNDSSVVVYSNEKAPSGFTRQSHYSVNMVGTGMMAFLYWLNAMVMLGASVVIGWFYAFALFLSAVKRMILLISSTPFALMGSLRAIARTIIYAIAMIAEVVMTMIAYYIVVAILSGLNTLVEQPLVDEIANSPTIILGGQPVAIGSVFAAVLMVALLLSTIITILFVTMAMKVRTSLVKFVDELVTETIDAFIGVKSGADPGGSSSLGQKMAAGIGAGVGAGLAHKAATSADSKATAGADTKGVALDQDKHEGGGGTAELTEGGGGPDGGPPTLAAGDAAGGGGNTSIQNNISDDDTATAQFEGADTDDATEIDAANSMTSLAGAEENRTENDADVEAGVAAAEATAQSADGADGADAVPVEGDAETVQDNVEAGGDVDTVQDEQNIARDTGEQAADAGGEASGGAAVAASGDSQGAGAPGGGKTDSQSNRSGSVDEALARNADSKQRLAQAQAEAAKAGMTPAQIAATMGTAQAAGQQGNKQPGVKQGGKPAQQGVKQVATAKPGVQNPHGGTPATKPVAGSQPHTAVQGQAPGSNSAVGTGTVPGGVAVAGSTPAGELPQNRVATPGAVPVSGEQPGSVGAIPAGYPAGSAVIGQAAPNVVQTGVDAFPVQSTGPALAATGGVAGQPSAVQGSVAGQPSVTAGTASVLAAPSGQGGVPVGAIPITHSPSGNPVAVTGHSQSVGQAVPGAVPAAGVHTVPGAPSVAAAPGAAGGQPAAVGTKPGQPAAIGIKSGQPAAAPAGQSQGRPGVQTGEQPVMQTGPEQRQTVQSDAVQQPGVHRPQPSGGQPKGQTSVPVGSPQQILDALQHGQPAQKMVTQQTGPNGVRTTTETTVERGGTTTVETHTGPGGVYKRTTMTGPNGESYTALEGVVQMASAPIPARRQPSAMKTAAAAAMAAFLTASDNPVVSGVGSGLQAGQMASWIRGTQTLGGSPGGGTPMYEFGISNYEPGQRGKPGGDAEVISALDSETAQIEAQIEALKAQTMTSLGKKKALPAKPVDEIK